MTSNVNRSDYSRIRSKSMAIGSSNFKIGCRLFAECSCQIYIGGHGFHFRRNDRVELMETNDVGSNETWPEKNELRERDYETMRERERERERDRYVQNVPKLRWSRPICPFFFQLGVWRSRSLLHRRRRRVRPSYESQRRNGTE